MRIERMPRGYGKTYMLITIAAERDAYIVCMNKQEAERIFDIAQDRELDILYPITFAEFANRSYIGKIERRKEMLIDEVDKLLIYLAGMNISYCTYTPT